MTRTRMRTIVVVPLARIVLALAAALSIPPCIAVPVDPALTTLAAAAKSAFRAALEPPPIALGIDDIADRESGVVVRRELVRAYDAAIDALLVEATRPERAGPVAAALRTIVRTGDARAADRLLSDAARRDAATAAPAAAAAAMRASVALDALPRALAEAARSPGLATSPRESGRPPEASALSAFVDAEARDPDDPRNPLVIAWLTALDVAVDDAHALAGSTASSSAEAACRRGLAARGTADDAPVRIALLSEAARIAARNGDRPQADAHLQRALAIANDAVRRTGSKRDLREATFVLDALGESRRADGDVQAAREALERSLRVREILAASSPDDVGAQTDLIAVHVALARLPRGADGIDHRAVATGLRDRLAARDPSPSIVGPSYWVSRIAEIVVVSGGLVAVGALVALAAYRRRMRDLVAFASRAGRGIVPAASAPDSRRTATARAPAAADRWTAWVEGTGALAFTVVAVALVVGSGTDAATLAHVASTTASCIWPVVFVPYLLRPHDRRALGLVLVGGLGVFTGQVIAAPTTDLVESIGPLLPSLAPLLFVDRRVRAFGPFVVVASTVVAVAGLGLDVLASTSTGRPLLVGLARTIALPPAAWAPLAIAIGPLLAVPLAGLAGLALARAYRARWVDDTSLASDAIWLWQALVVTLTSIRAAGLPGVAGLSAFIAYRIVTTVGGRRVARSRARCAPATLVLLRILDAERRGEPFAETLAVRWRRAGPLRIVVPPELARRSAGPGASMDFIAGRLRGRFVVTPVDLRRRLAGLAHRPGPTGAYRVDTFVCGMPSWQATVAALASRSDLVALDLRGFGSEHRARLFEIRALLADVSSNRIALLTDAATDRASLRAIVDAGIGRSARSDRPAVTVVAVDDRGHDAIDALLARAAA